MMLLADFYAAASAIGVVNVGMKSVPEGHSCGASHTLRRRLP